MQGSRITEQLIKSVSNTQQLTEIRTLSLRSFKIAKIESMDSLLNLTELNLSHNMIQKIDNLSSLKQLRDLNLSDNSIKSMQGLDQLVQLQKLNLNGNLIQEIVLSNQSITVLKLSRNQIKDTAQLVNLKVLVNLQQLSISDNPFCRSYNYCELLLFLNPKLEVVDNKVLSKEQIQLTQQLFGEPTPSSIKQIEQNIRMATQQRSEIDQQLTLIENKIHKATNLLQTYYDVSDSDEDAENDKIVTQSALQSLHQQLEYQLQRKQETEELLTQMQMELEEYRVVQEPKIYCPTSMLNRINSLFVRLQAVLGVDMINPQRSLFEGALAANVDQLLNAHYEVLEIVLDRIPHLPQESALQEASEQIHQQIQELYKRVAANDSKESEVNHPIERSIVLLKKLYKRADKKFKRLDEFNDLRQQFLRDFEEETQTLADRWKDYEFKKQQLKEESDLITKEIEEQIGQITREKADLQQKHQQVDQLFQESNADFEEFRIQQQKIRNELEVEMQQLMNSRNELSSQVLQLKLEADRIHDRNAEGEESVRLLAEEIEMLQQRIQDQYQLSFEIRQEQQQALQNIDQLTQQKSEMTLRLDELTEEIEEKTTATQSIKTQYFNEQGRMTQMYTEIESVHSKLKNTEQLCKEADKVLRSLNLAVQDKEDDLSKYDRILGEAKEERERLKQLKAENIQLKKELSRLKTDLENTQFQYSQNSENLQQAKKNLQQITQLTIEKEQELVQSEKELIVLEKQIQELSRSKEQNHQENEEMKREQKRLQLEKAKLNQQVDDAAINVSSLKQEYQIQHQNLQSLNKQLEMKVTELSTTTHYHKAETEQGQEQLQVMHQQLLKMQENCDHKGYEFKQLADQIESLMQKRDILIKEVYGLQTQVMNQEDRVFDNNSITKQQRQNVHFHPKPYILNDDESIQQFDGQSMLDKLRSEVSQLGKQDQIRHFNTKSQQVLHDYPRIFKPRSANQSLLMGMRKSPQKDNSVQSVMQNLEELNNNLDRMYLESREQLEY